jgi:hypothetical protein
MLHLVMREADAAKCLDAIASGPEAR